MGFAQLGHGGSGVLHSLECQRGLGNAHLRRELVGIGLDRGLETTEAFGEATRAEQRIAQTDQSRRRLRIDLQRLRVCVFRMSDAGARQVNVAEQRVSVHELRGARGILLRDDSFEQLDRVEASPPLFQITRAISVRAPACFGFFVSASRASFSACFLSPLASSARARP